MSNSKNKLKLVIFVSTLGMLIALGGISFTQASFSVLLKIVFGTGLLILFGLQTKNLISSALSGSTQVFSLGLNKKKFAGQGILFAVILVFGIFTLMSGDLQEAIFPFSLFVGLMGSSVGQNYQFIAIDSEEIRIKGDKELVFKFSELETLEISDDELIISDAKDKLEQDISVLSGEERNEIENLVKQYQNGSLQIENA